MVTLLIVTVTLVNAVLAGIFLRKFARERSVLGLTFTVGWALHYVVGNIFTLLSRDLTYTFLPFEEFETSYLLALLAGTYFLPVYAHLTRKVAHDFEPASHFGQSALLPLLIFFLVSVACGVALILRIGVSEYFSPELAQFRARLGEHAGEGVGVYYYLATLLITSSLMLGSYAIRFPSKTIICFALLGLIAAFAVFVPFGGRGRVLNILIVLFISYFISKGEYRLTRIMSLRTLLLILTMLAVAYVWGVVREDPLAEVSTDTGQVLRALSVDLTRLPQQAFILDRYPLSGTYWGTHYLESVLGPLVKVLPLEPVGLVQELSAQWYLQTIEGMNVMSAISPSFLGELYLNFGVVGLLLGPFALFAVVTVFARVFGKRHPLSLAVIIWFFQFNVFNGGMYATFDILVFTLPLFVVTRALARTSPNIGRKEQKKPFATAYKGKTSVPASRLRKGLHE